MQILLNLSSSPLEGSRWFSSELQQSSQKKKKARQEKPESQRHTLVYVGGVVVGWEVIVSLYPDVLDVLIGEVWGGAAGAQRSREQVLNVLQLQALRLRQAPESE